MAEPSFVVEDEEILECIGGLLTPTLALFAASLPRPRQSKQVADFPPYQAPGIYGRRRSKQALQYQSTHDGSEEPS